LWISTSPDTHAVEETPHKIDGGGVVDAPSPTFAIQKATRVVTAPRSLAKAEFAFSDCFE
jgi:hypothetical protein